jgi:hypothetical protein
MSENNPDRSFLIPAQSSANDPVWLIMAIECQSRFRIKTPHSFLGFELGLNMNIWQTSLKFLFL